MPVSAACKFTLPPGQIAPPPLTIAVGKGVIVTVLVQVLPHPLALVTVRFKVKVPAEPALITTLEPFAWLAIVPLPATDQR